MGIVSSRRSKMAFFSAANDPWSQRARIVLLEKNVAFELIETDSTQFPDELLDFNPYRLLPTLVDRDLVVYDSQIIMEYIDERFPHPPLLPVDPIARARARVMLYRIERDWLSLIPALEGDDKKAKEAARSRLRDALTSIAPVFQAKPFFMSDEFSMIDSTIGALLWRLPSWKIELPAHAKPIHAYADRIFNRPSFQASLTEAERQLRE